MTAHSESRERIALITGRLAEPALRRLIEGLPASLQVDAEILVMEIAVAALMTPAWLARRLRGPLNATRLVVPGYCKGDLEVVSSVAGIPVERGPRDLRQLPRWLADGKEFEDGGPPGYGSYRLEIIAEINNAPELDLEELLAAASRYREAGAEVIDVGCTPGRRWHGLGDAARALRGEGYRVAIDTFDQQEIVDGAAAGAELVLSINGTNIEVARDLECEVVAIPDDIKTLGGLDATLARLTDWKVPYRLDPILEPLGFGFAASLGRYLEVRRRYPESAMMMGVGNITELTDVDSAGINALLVGFCEELDIGSVLTTEVIPWAASAVREIDIARRLMHHAISQGVLPKHLENRLICLRDAENFEYGQEVLDAMAAKITDPNYRIFAERGEIHVMNRAGYHRADDPFEIFAKLGMEDAPHAFYLGFEMAKALTALQLGKQYSQDQALDWGFLTVAEKIRHGRRGKHGTDAAADESNGGPQ